VILAFMFYSLAVAALAALAGWLAEKAFGQLGRARRVAWIAGLCAALLVPLLALVPQDALPAPGGSPAPSATANPIVWVLTVPPAVAQFGDARVGAWTLDAAAALAWAMLSATAMLYYGASAWRLSRLARRWRETHIDDRAVTVAPDLGPAVFGWIRPKIIFPAWLTAAPPECQRLVLAHEAQHLAARDPQVLAVANVVCALFPWNPALAWMLRRLRFAMEVDCDARVLRGGADAGNYGMALLYVSERQSRFPAAAAGNAMALIERASQLERRIHIMFSTRKLSALAATLCLALASTCIVAAATLDRPSVAAGATAVLKPPPGRESMGFKLGQHFEKHIQEKYPELMGGHFDGMPMIVALMNDDWSVAKSVKTMNPDPKGEINATNELFGLLGIAPADAPYVGAMHMQMAKDKFVVMVYTERSRPGERFVSKIFPDTRKQDRELFEQAFPGTTVVPAGQNPWVLLDRSGKVLRKGIEPVTPAWNDTLEKRFAGIDTQEVTVTPITDATGEPMRDTAGKELHLHSLWLAPESAPPSN
jgi:hypothetical protein